jgi:hypothetical protein
MKEPLPEMECEGEVGLYEFLTLQILCITCRSHALSHPVHTVQVEFSGPIACKAPGFNPCALHVISWFQILLSNGSTCTAATSRGATTSSPRSSRARTTSTSVGGCVQVE